MAKSDGPLFKSTSPMSPPPPLQQSAVAGRLVRQAERKRERGEQGLHQGCSLDRANKSRPVTCSMAPFEERGKFGQSEEKGRHSLFSLPKQLTARDRQEVRRAGRAGICFHGYGPGMGTLLLRKLRSHAPTEAMSRILKMRQARARTASTSDRDALWERGMKMIARQCESRGSALGWGRQHVLEQERNASYDRVTFIVGILWRLKLWFQTGYNYILS